MKKSLYLEVKQSIVIHHTCRQSPHLGCWYAYALWRQCHADAGLNPPDVKLTDNQLADVPYDIEYTDDTPFPESVTPTPNPANSKAATGDLSTAAPKPPEQRFRKEFMSHSSSSSSLSFSADNP
jgi:hypothetical protein